MNLAPICLFTYNRLEETKQTIEALRNNYLAKESHLYIFSDGAKSDTAKEKIQKVRSYLKTIEGFGSIQVFESPINKGLASSIIDGVTQVVNQYGKVIVLEDNLITLSKFSHYMNQSLDFHNDTTKVFQL